MKRFIYLLFVPLLLFLSPPLAAQVVPLPNAHAHNDYEHPRPLLDALSHGFTSIEADIFLLKNELYVSHNRPLSLKNVRTLETLYLQPLDSMVKVNNGRVYPAYDGVFYLMLDFKTQGDETYQKLQEVLQNYRHLLAVPPHHGPITLFISGERPYTEILNSSGSLAGLDGRPNDLEQGIPREKMPVVSASFKSLGYWNGNGEIPMDIRIKIRQIAEAAHKEGKKFRLWAIPDNPEAWQVMLDSGVDLINTDQLEKLKSFLHK